MYAGEDPYLTGKLPDLYPISCMRCSYSRHRHTLTHPLIRESASQSILLSALIHILSALIVHSYVMREPKVDIRIVRVLQVSRLSIGATGEYAAEFVQGFQQSPVDPSEWWR